MIQYKKKASALIDTRVPVCIHCLPNKAEVYLFNPPHDIPPGVEHVEPASGEGNYRGQILQGGYRRSIYSGDYLLISQSGKATVLRGKHLDKIYEPVKMLTDGENLS